MTIYDIDQREKMILDQLFEGQIEPMAAVISLEHLFKVRDAILKGEIFKPQEPVKYKVVEQIEIRKNDTTTIIWDAVMIQQMEKDLEDLKKRSGLVPSRLKEPSFNMKDIPIAVAFPEPIQIKQTDFSVLYLPIFPQNGVNSALIWTGPGWYVVDVVEPDLWFALIAGPFDSYERVAQELRHANTED